MIKWYTRLVSQHTPHTTRYHIAEKYLIINMLITLHIPFGNQTWQREISHLEMMFPFQCPFKSGISQPAIFDCQRVSTNIPFTLLIFHENFNTSPFYYDFTEKRIYSHLQKYIQEKNHSNSGK